MPDDLRLVERLRALRNHPAKELSLAPLIGDAADGYKRRMRNLGSLGAAWRDLAPPELVNTSELVGLARGVLTIRAADSAARFEIDRWLRGGGEIELVKRAAARLTRVRVV